MVVDITQYIVHITKSINKKAIIIKSILRKGAILITQQNSIKATKMSSQLFTFLLIQLKSSKFKKPLLKKVFQKLKPFENTNIQKHDIIMGITQDICRVVYQYRKVGTDISGKVSMAMAYLVHFFSNDLNYQLQSDKCNKMQVLVRLQLERDQPIKLRMYTNPKANNLNSKQNVQYVQNIWSQKNYQYPCICPKAPSSLIQHRLDQVCYKCLLPIHSSCLWRRPLNQALYECPSCFLLQCLPHKPIHTVLFAGYLPTIKSSLINYHLTFNVPEELSTRKQVHFEVRCVRLGSQKNVYQITWPDRCLVTVDNKKIGQMLPLGNLASIKRRNDDQLIIPKERMMDRLHHQLVVQEKHQYDFSTVKYQKANHYVMILAVTHVKEDVIIQKLKKNSLLSICQSKQLLRSNLTGNGSSQVSIQKLTISLSCQYFSTPIIFPGRSRHCQHPQIFDIYSFLSINSSTSKSSTQKYKCPICKKRSYDLLLDQYLLGLIGGKEMVKGITFGKDGEVVFQQGVEEEDKDEQDFQHQQDYGEQNYRRLLALECIQPLLSNHQPQSQDKPSQNFFSIIPNVTIDAKDIFMIDVDEQNSSFSQPQQILEKIEEVQKVPVKRKIKIKRAEKPKKRPRSNNSSDQLKQSQIRRILKENTPQKTLQKQQKPRKPFSPQLKQHMPKPSYLKKPTQQITNSFINLTKQLLTKTNQYNNQHFRQKKINNHMDQDINKQTETNRLVQAIQISSSQNQEFYTNYKGGKDAKCNLGQGKSNSFINKNIQANILLDKQTNNLLDKEPLYYSEESQNIPNHQQHEIFVQQVEAYRNIKNCQQKNSLFQQLQAQHDDGRQLLSNQKISLISNSWKQLLSKQRKQLLQNQEKQSLSNQEKQQSQISISKKSSQYQYLFQQQLPEYNKKSPCIIQKLLSQQQLRFKKANKNLHPYPQQSNPIPTIKQKPIDKIEQTIYIEQSKDQVEDEEKFNDGMIEVEVNKYQIEVIGLREELERQRLHLDRRRNVMRQLEPVTKEDQHLFWDVLQHFYEANQLLSSN